MEAASKQALAFLKTRFPDGEFKMTSAYQSYITGLRYFPKSDKPVANTVYVCKRDLENTKFPNSTRVYSDKHAIGYVPRDLAKILVSELDDFMDTRVLLCFCKQGGTAFSAPCFYFVFELVPVLKEQFVI